MLKEKRYWKNRSKKKFALDEICFDVTKMRYFDE